LTFNGLYGVISQKTVLFIETMGFTETSVKIYRNTWCHISEASNLLTQRRENLKSHFAKWFLVFRLYKRNRRKLNQEYHNPGLLRFLESFIELVGVADGVEG
jgi:hypothetical protein